MKEGSTLDEKKKIGIKIADGTFFPVLEGNTDKKKRLVLTTVNDNQTSVQIDLYEGVGDEFADPVYVGTMVIDNIAPAEKGTPEIEMVMGVGEDNVLSATAKDLASGLEESLSVSIESLDETEVYDVPEFTLEDEDFEFDDDMFGEEKGEESEEPASGIDESLDSDFESDLSDDFMEEEAFEEHPLETIPPGEEEEEAFQSERVEHEAHKRGLNPFVLLLLVLIVLGLLGGVAYLVYNSFSGEKVPILQAKENTDSAEEASKAVTVKEGGNQAVQPAAAEESNTPAIEKREPVQAAPGSPPEKSAAPAAEAAKKSVNTDQGVWYRIRWGDTLWGISYSFYKSPTMYAKIAKENKIKDPDLIFAETKIFIPKE